METMDSLTQQKADILLKKFENSGMGLEYELSQEEILSFLNQNSKSGFDQNFSEKLFQVLGLEESKKITVEEFISYYIQFEEDLLENGNELKKKILTEKNNLNLNQEEMFKYKDEKLNSEGFCENAKLSVEITDIEIKKNLTDVNQIYLYLIYNNQKIEFNFDYSPNIITFNDKIFEFKSVSKKDHFELILKYTKNNISEAFELSTKVFPLEEIPTQDEYGVQITLPEEENQDQVVAFINSKITLHWSDYLYYEEKVKNCEIRIKKLNEASNKINQYINLIKEIYNSKIVSVNTNINNITSENTLTGQINQMDSVFSSEPKIPMDNIKEKKKKKKNNDDTNNELLKFEENFNDDFKDINEINNINIYEEKNYNNNSYKNLKAIPLIKLLSLLCILFAIFNSLQRPDYFSALIGIISFGYIFFIANRSFAIKSKNFWYLFLLVFSGFVWDLIWLYINLDLLENSVDYKGPYDNAIGKLCFFTTGLGCINKCCLAILVFTQYRLNY